MDITVSNLRKLFQSSHVNFLYGAGLSRNYLSTLGNIERLLTDVTSLRVGDNIKTIIKSSLYAAYFKTVMQPCLSDEILKRQKEYNDTYYEYVRFLKYLNHIISRRNVNLINKQINLFTTNIDDFMEKAAEETMVVFNDGFKGHITPIFSEDSFSTIVSKSSPLYQNTSAIPSFNLLKIHGSINWKSIKDSDISYDAELLLIKQISDALKTVPSTALIEIDEATTIDSLLIAADDIDLMHDVKEYEDFINLYLQLVMINPTKSKFSETVIEYHFYELMRMYSNALERVASLLVVAGFSFADEHITNITVRAANANPTLQIIVFAYNGDAKQDIQSKLMHKGICNNNISILSPEDYKTAAINENHSTKEYDTLTKFDFQSINDFVFDKLAASI